jgi:hypothetical protein
MTSRLPPPPIVSVYDGRRCVGFVFKRGDSFEAFDAHERTLGLFPSQREAAAVISRTAP